jgi:hypothetical protein
MRPQWYWLDWYLLQVIITTRLYAMYQRSRKILMFLIVTFPINVFEVALAVITTMHASGGTLNCGWKQMCMSSLMNTRGTHSLRHLSVLVWPWGTTSGFHFLGVYHCVGGPYTVSRSLGCGKTLPWNATTFGRADYWGLFHGVNQNSHTLLCEVSSHCDYYSRFSTEGLDMVACLLLLASSSFLIGLQHSQRYVNISLMCTRPWFIIIAELFSGVSDLYWVSSDCDGGADVYAGTTPDPWCSRISC